jgi:SAM-dependent methyltransferase
MYESDIPLLVCPLTFEHLRLVDVMTRDEDGEVIDATLEAVGSGHRYPVRNGIPRFADASANATWEYKWTEIDRGQGLNYRIIDRDDPAYEIHDLFDRNGHGGRAHAKARGGVALDVGCGIGQYSIRLAEEYPPRKLVALDLTGGVDIFRAILLERYPQHRERILIVQASIFEPPFRPKTFDLVMSLGVLMHTGDTLRAIERAGRLVRSGGDLNIWIYASEPVAYEAREVGRTGVRMPLRFIPPQVYYSVIWAWIRVFRALPHRVVVAIVRAFSSETWYRLSLRKWVGRPARTLFPSVLHPDQAYRYINNYDGYVNGFSDTWSEHEVLPLLRRLGFQMQGLADHRLGIWSERSLPFEVD